jgi:enterochelin esterase-like enzyme
MRRRKAIILCSLLALGAITFLARHRLRRLIPSRWENTGDYAGPLTRPAIPYNPSKAPSRPWLDPQRVAPPPTTYHAYTAATIGRQTDYLLYLPPGYDDPADRDRRYPVIYWLHGYSCGPQHGSPFVDTLDAAIRAGHMPATIAVLPNGLYDSWFVDSVDGSQPVESVIIKDLIPHVDKTWRTIPDRRARALEGFSMGGWGALHLAFKYPELFGSVTSVSAPFHRAERFWQLKGIFGDASAYYVEDPVTRARRNAAQLHDARAVRIRLLCGDKDEQHHLGYNLAFDKRLKEWQIPHELIVVPGAGHNDGDIYEKLGPQAFAFYRDLINSAHD